MEITKTTHGQITVLSVQGQLDAITAPQLERELQALSETGTDHFIVDLGGVQLISSAALRVLLSAAKFTKKQQGQILLCALTPEVKKVFELSGLTNLFNLQPTLDDALKSLGATDNPPPSEPPPAPAPEPPPATPPVLKADPAPEPPPTPPAQAPLISTDDEPPSDSTLEDVSPRAAAAALLATAPAEEAAPAVAVPPVPAAPPATPAVPPPPRLVFEPVPAEPPPAPDPDATLLPKSAPPAPPTPPPQPPPTPEPAPAPPPPPPAPATPPPPPPAPATPPPPPPASATPPPPPPPVIAADPPPPPVTAAAPPPAVTPPPPIPAPVAVARPAATPPPPVPAPIAAPTAPPARAATPPPPVPAPVASARSITPPPPVAATKPPPPPPPIAATIPRQNPPSKSSNLTIIIAGASAVFLALCLVVALMMRHSHEPKTTERQPSESPAPTVANDVPGPTVEPPGPTVSLTNTTPADASSPPAPDSVQAPAAVSLNADDAASQDTRQDVLKRIDAMPLAQNKKDQLYKSVETAHHMGRVITIGFDTGRTDLSAAAIANLKKTISRSDIQTVINDPSVVVVILGFADSKGAAGKNKEISEHRAERTMKALRESCGLENVMHEIGMGGSEFLAKGNAEKNRVVEVWVVKP